MTEKTKAIEIIELPGSHVTEQSVSAALAVVREVITELSGVPGMAERIAFWRGVEREIQKVAEEMEVLV